jgi:hypothetical protein
VGGSARLLVGGPLEKTVALRADRVADSGLDLLFFDPVCHS